MQAKSSIVSVPCSCDIKLLMDVGCQCGAFAREQRLRMQASASESEAPKTRTNPMDVRHWVPIRFVVGRFEVGDIIQSVVDPSRYWEVIGSNGMGYTLKRPGGRPSTYGSTIVHNWKMQALVPLSRVSDARRKEIMNANTTGNPR